MKQSQPSLPQNLMKFESALGMIGGSNNTRGSQDQEVGGLCLMYMEAGLQGHTRASQHRLPYNVEIEMAGEKSTRAKSMRRNPIFGREFLCHPLRQILPAELTYIWTNGRRLVACLK